jgi:hypothetical protein
MISAADLEKLLNGVKAGQIEIAEAVRRLSAHDQANLGFARVDLGRLSRCGIPEVVFAEGKSAEHVREIAAKIVENGHDLLITRLDAEVFESLSGSLPALHYNKNARAAYVRQKDLPLKEGILIVSAGTSDIPVAEEAAVTCEVLGFQPARLFDAGVAGIHRLLTETEQLRNARAIVVVAGMEGALPSVVGGLVSVPVIAVPTSVGYGASFGGIAALLAMLNSCASGVTVVNIDNGFGAAIAAIRILQTNAAGDSQRGKQ